MLAILFRRKLLFEGVYLVNCILDLVGLLQVRFIVVLKLVCHTLYCSSHIFAFALHFIYVFLVPVCFSGQLFSRELELCDLFTEDN